MTHIELNVRRSALAATVAAAARRAIETTCMPFFAAVAYVDHIEVIEDKIHLTQDQGATLRVPAHVFLVTQSALMAAPNDVPTGATAPPHPITLIYEIRAEVRKPNPPDEPVTMRHSFISFIARDPDLGPLGGTLGPAAQPLRDAIRNATQIPPTELTGLFREVKVGPRQFARDVPVPDIALASANLRPQSLVNGPAGNVLAGSLAPRPWHKVDFALEPGRLSGPVRLQSCRERAKAGTGDPDRSPLTLDNSMYLPNCLHFFDWGLLWGRLPGESNRMTVDVFKPPPLEDPSWTEFLRGGHG